MRSLVFPKLISPSDWNQSQFSSPTNMIDSPHGSVSAHSRESSGASDSYSPVTPTFSLRDPARLSSSSSSLATSPPNWDPPESPTCVSKTRLHDLVEDPEERDDELVRCTDDLGRCSYEFCQRENSPMTTQASARADLDYDLNDGFCSESETSLQDTRKQHQFGDVPSPVANLASRLSQRLPSFSRKLKDRSPTTSVNRQGIRSAPISRTPSFRMPSLTKSLATHLETRGPYTPPDTPVDAVHDDQLPEPAPPVDIALPTRMEDPIDRQALASTPLLPPTMMDRRGSDAESMQSPLQSPTIADSATFSFIASPSSTPAMQFAQTPPLSSKPSNSSIGMVRSSQLLPSADIPSVALSNAEDKWAAKLGHANFDIFPEPYLPESHDTSSFKRLTEDWESARKQYMKHAVYTSDNYGPTSQTYKHTEQKWAAIDAQWKRNHEIVASRAAANGESAVFQPLAEPAALAKIPSIDGPESEGKFPTLENAQIVGPMVQYAKVHRQRPRRSTIMKFFSDLRLTSPPSRPRSSSR